MADFGRGFGQTFGPAFQRGLGTAEISRKQTAKEEQRLQDFDTLVTAIGEDRLESVGLSGNNLTAIRSSSDPSNALKSFFEIREIQRKLPTTTEAGRFVEEGISPSITQKPLDVAGGLETIQLPGRSLKQAFVQGRLAQATQPLSRLRLEQETQKSISGLTTRTLKRVPTKKEQKVQAIAKGREKGIEEAAKLATGIKTASKRLASISRQFDEALPTGDTSPFVQRILGSIASIGAETGLVPNPQLVALQRTAKLQLRAILRNMGEGARLSDQDITQNIKLIEQATLTGDERQALVRSFLQTAVDSMDESTIGTFTEDPGTVKILQELGVKIPGLIKEKDVLETLTTPTGVEFKILK